MKKLAFFLALFVGLNASVVARKPEEEANEVIVVSDTSRHSNAAWIQRIAHRLKACYYGITKEGIIHELGFEIMHKIKKSRLNNDLKINLPKETSNALNNNHKGKAVWIYFSYELENGIECLEIRLFP